MLRTSCDDELIWVLAGKLHRITDHVSPQSAGRRNHHCVILVKFHLFEAVSTWIFLINFFQWNELVENTVVDHQQHGRVRKIVLRTKVSFGSVVGLYIMHHL